MILSWGKADRRVVVGAGETARSAIETGRERPCTTSARERRLAETDVTSNEGVEESEREDGKGGEISAGITTGGAKEDGLPTDGSSSLSGAGSPSEEPSSGIISGVRVQIVALQDALSSEGYKEGEHRR
jgi:hypothetical protein